MKIAPALGFIIFLILPDAAWSQAPPIKVDLAPLLSTLNHRSWFHLPYNKGLADAVQAALTQAPFQTASSSGPDVLTLAIPDKVRTEKEQYLFTVAFSRDGVKLGEAVESCPTKKLAECTDQLVLDTKTAANN